MTAHPLRTLVALIVCMAVVFGHTVMLMFNIGHFKAKLTPDLYNYMLWTLISMPFVGCILLGIALPLATAVLVPTGHPPLNPVSARRTEPWQWLCTTLGMGIPNARTPYSGTLESTPEGGAADV